MRRFVGSGPRAVIPILRLGFHAHTELGAFCAYPQMGLVKDARPQRLISDLLLLRPWSLTHAEPGTFGSRIFTVVSSWSREVDREPLFQFSFQRKGRGIFAEELSVIEVSSGARDPVSRCLRESIINRFDA